VINRRLSWHGRSRALFAGVGAGALAVLAGATLPGGAAGAAASAPAASGAVRLSAAPLGIDVAPWDSLLANATTQGNVLSLLKKAGVTQLHYGGGVTADLYDWQTDTDIGNCPSTSAAEFTAKCAVNDALPFSLLSQNARTLGAQSYVTVNYGSGTPAMAAAWVQQASGTPGQAVTDWEIGNESYGCWEANNWLAAPSELYAGYQANNNATCPMVAEGLDAGMTTMAKSYAANAAQYITAMKAQDPNAQIGVPWAFDWTVGGATVGDNQTWNNTVLGKNGHNLSFVDAHWYPFGFGGNTGANGNPTDQAVIKSVTQIPGEYAKIRATLNTYAPSAHVIVGETGVSYLATNVPCKPAGALFAAGDALEWLAAGAQSIDWWPLDTDANLGTSCSNPDEAMFTNAGGPTTPYTGYLLASALAKPGAQLSTLATSSSDVLGFQSLLPNGKSAVALINTSTSSARTVTFSSSLAGNLVTESYSAGNQNATNSRIVTGTSTAGALSGGITLPAESITILNAAGALKPSSMTLTGSASVKAGAKVTLSGKLSLSGITVPGGVPVKVYRKLGSKVQATLTAKTVAGGGFTVTDLPASAGSYVYQASYLSNSYLPASASYAVKVTAAKPSLKLALSAASVRPGQKITVTATLGAPHVNKTLVIYAQPKGAAKKVIKRAAVNAKGQVSVVYPVPANTTFTLVFAGDTWYTSGSVTAVVKA
jgi:hypothetical protein